MVFWLIGTRQGGVYFPENYAQIHLQMFWGCNLWCNDYTDKFLKNKMGKCNPRSSNGTNIFLGVFLIWHSAWAAMMTKNEGDGADRAGVIGLIRQGFGSVELEADQHDRDRVSSDQGFLIGRSGHDQSDRGQPSSQFLWPRKRDSQKRGSVWESATRFVRIGRFPILGHNCHHNLAVTSHLVGGVFQGGPIGGHGCHYYLAVAFHLLGGVLQGVPIGGHGCHDYLTVAPHLLGGVLQGERVTGHCCHHYLAVAPHLLGGVLQGKPAIGHCCHYYLAVAPHLLGGGRKGREIMGDLDQQGLTGICHEELLTPWAILRRRLFCFTHSTYINGCLDS